MLAPMIFPMDKLDSFLRIAVSVVTSSGREVPTATSVTAIIRSSTPNAVAIALPPSTRNSEPITIAAAPARKIILFFS